MVGMVGAITGGEDKGAPNSLLAQRFPVAVAHRAIYLTSFFRDSISYWMVMAICSMMGAQKGTFFSY